MSALREAIDTTALGWVKPELDETMRQVRLEVEAWVEDPTDIGPMRACVDFLHQVLGTLRMVELNTAAMVAEEMERLAQTLVAGQAPERDEACTALMRGVVLLPDYLERLQGGHKDIPIVLLPLLNELRAARGETGLTESVLFAPDMDQPLPASLPATSAQPRQERVEQVAPHLAAFRTAMGNWPNTGGPVDPAGLASAIEGILALAQDDAARRMLWVAASVASALRDDAMVANPAMRQAFAAIEHEARGMFEGDGGAAAHDESAIGPDFEPTRQLLFHVAHTSTRHDGLDKLRDTYGLETSSHSESELAHARGSLSGRNRALLHTVSAAIKEDLLRVKDALDLHLRTQQSGVGELKTQVEALTRVADTLGMMGLTVARNVVLQQRDAMHEIVEGNRDVDEGALLDVAGALLYVDASLDDQVARLGLPAEQADHDMLAGESRKVLDVLVREAIANFEKARRAFVAFVETNWDHAELAAVPRQLEEVTGALRMLEQPLPGDYLTGVRRYTEIELLGNKRIPDSQQLDTLADALVSIEYFLEALRDQRPKRDEILNIARHSLETLGYWPVPELKPVAKEALNEPYQDSASTTAPVVRDAHSEADQSVTEVSVADVPGTEPSAAGQSIADRPADEVAAVEQTVPDDEAISEHLSTPAPASAATSSVEPAPVAAAPASTLLSGGDDGFQSSDDIDDEIREIFLEEFSEEVENLNAMLPPWRNDPDNLELLRPIRRVFHTLKGSGRLVGARTLGEFSWKIESALNQVLDGARLSSPAVVAMVDMAHQTLPQLQAALSGEGAITADLVAMQALAEKVAAGEEVFYSAPASEAPVVAGSDSIEPPLAETDVDVEDTIEASVDPVLLEILDAEVKGHLGTVERWLTNVRAAPQPPADALLRAVHTMNGAFAMTEVPSVTNVTTPTEAYIQRMIAAEVAPSDDGIVAIEDVVTAIRRTMDVMQASMPRVPVFTALAARMATLRDSLPEVTKPVLPMQLEDSADDDVLSASGEVELLESERIDSERAEVERVEAERVEAERVEAERVEAERVEAERVEAERAESERLESERVAAERAEAERIEAERVEAERVEAERLESERVAAERTEVERVEAERLESERVAAERTEAERIEAERIEAERVKAERVETERLESERVEAERVEAERIEAERIEAERVEAERVETERLESERVEAERVESERVEAERAEAERVESERVEAERAEAERAEAERVQAERAEATVTPMSVDVPAAALGAAAVAAEDPDEALDLSDLDLELVDIFVEEAGDLLDHSDGLLAQLRESPGDHELVVGLQRDLHTLKGGARMAGIMAVGELGHTMESLLEVVADGQRELGDDGVRLLERGFDRLHAMTTRVGARRAIAMPLNLISEFDARARGRVATPTSAITSVGTAAEVAFKPLSAPIETKLDNEDDASALRAPQEQVRIRADLLDRLVNYAGEVAIYRARLEQQLGAFRGAMTEMEQTNMRLRDQLRRLDIETEAQIIARYQREDNVDQTFDPLELDRFSTLQQLSRGLAESAADMSSLQGSLDDLTSQYETLLLQQSRVSSDLQEGLMRTRMVPFESMVPRLRRVVRQAATETGKQVQLKLEGAAGELDRNVLDRITAPLEHMLRNSVAHGLESPKQRKQAKKPEEGTVRIALRREGSEVVLEVSDDGAGLDREAIRKRALERGLIRADAILADSDLDALILEQGFSTADSVSRLAGRGVGMDVVHNEVRQLGGTLDIVSKPGEGARFILRLPQTLAVTQAAFVRIGETTFAVPIASVRGVGRIARDELGKADASYSYGGEDYAVHDLGKLVGHAQAKAEGYLEMPLLLIRSGDLRAAVSVDQVLANREIVVKPVGPQVASVPGIFGATIMGDGGVVVILDIAPLVRRQTVSGLETQAAPVVEQRHIPLVMVIDDSVTMRKVTGRVLERHNFEVMTAKDGVDALERLAERIPDVVLLDIEMPRMDGYELTAEMKADPRLRDIPIMMITSRTGDKHRQRALDLGVNRYLGKPYQEHELLRNVFELLSRQVASVESTT